MLQRRSMLPRSSGSAPGARATGMSDEQKSGIPRPQVGGLPRVAVGPSSPQEEGKEEVLKDEFIFPQPEPQPEPVLEDAKEAAVVAQRQRLAAMEAQGALPEPQPEPVVEGRKKKGKPWHRRPRGLAVELALSRVVIIRSRVDGWGSSGRAGLEWTGGARTKPFAKPSSRLHCPLTTTHQLQRWAAMVDAMAASEWLRLQPRAGVGGSRARVGGGSLALPPPRL